MKESNKHDHEFQQTHHQHEESQRQASKYFALWNHILSQTIVDFCPEGAPVVSLVSVIGMLARVALIGSRPKSASLSSGHIFTATDPSRCIEVMTPFSFIHRRYQITVLKCFYRWFASDIADENQIPVASLKPRRICIDAIQYVQFSVISGIQLLVHLGYYFSSRVHWGGKCRPGGVEAGSVDRLQGVFIQERRCR